jgi:hypothetical protein
MEVATDWVPMFGRVGEFGIFSSIMYSFVVCAKMINLVNLAELALTTIAWQETGQ